MRWLPAASLAAACALVAAGSLLAPAAGSAVPSGRPCGAVAVPAEPSMFGYPPTVGAQAVWARRVSCRAARRVVRLLVAGRAVPTGWACSYTLYNPASCRAPGGRRIETLTVSDGR